MGLVGESGCGKTTIAKSILKLLPSNGEIMEGKIVFKGRDIRLCSHDELRNIRWKEISYIPQNAMNSLNPVVKVFDQIFEAILAHTKMKREEARGVARRLFKRMGLRQEVLEHYPHELSGGMKQRVVMAMALVLDPSLVIADEPVTGLDLLTQDRILRWIDELHEKFDLSMIYISHNVSVVAERCNKVAVMYAGQIVEFGEADQVFSKPKSPYFIGLINAIPKIGIQEKLISIPGQPPNLINPPKGCRFNDRCPFSKDICFEEEPQLVQADDGCFVRCHFMGNCKEFRKSARREATWQKKSA